MSQPYEPTLGPTLGANLRSQPQETTLGANLRSKHQEQTLGANLRSKPQERTLRSKPQERTLGANLRSEPRKQLNQYEFLWTKFKIVQLQKQHDWGYHNCKGLLYKLLHSYCQKRLLLFTNIFAVYGYFSGTSFHHFFFSLTTSLTA